MRWDVRIRKTLGTGAQGFALDVAFRTDVARLVLYGPSGAGKSLTLKAVAGLLSPDEGHIRVDGETLFDSATGIDVAAPKRRFAYLFQEYALFPHLSVRQNVAFGLTRSLVNPRRDAASAAVDGWLDTFELRPLAGRYPDQLSGGQRQRTALARALAAEPRALLLDEPFAALDTALRWRLRDELRELQARLSLPLVLITHDAADVDAFAEDVVHLEAGRVTGATTPTEGQSMKTSARNQFSGVVSRTSAGSGSDEIELTLDGGLRLVAALSPGRAMQLGLAIGGRAFALIKASSIVVMTDLGDARFSTRNQLAGRVSAVRPGAVNAEVQIDVGSGVTVAAIVTQASLDGLGIAPGQPATAMFEASSVILGVRP